MENNAIEGRIKYFKENLDTRIKSFKEYRQKMKKRAFAMKMITVFLGVTTTILLGLKSLEEVNVLTKDVAFVSSSLVTLFLIWDGFFNFRERWIIYSDITSRLSNIKYELDYISAGEINSVVENRVNELHKLFLETLSASTEMNIKAKSQGNPQKNQ